MIENLIQEISSLKKQLQEKDLLIKQKDIHLERLAALLDSFRRGKFASKSEQVSSEQLGLFNETELLSAIEDIESKEEDEQSSEQKPIRKRGKRQPLPENLPREDVVIELSEEERICPTDGGLLKEIGEEVSERLKIIPPQVVVVRTIRKKYACQTCNESIKTAPSPLTILPKSNVDASLLAYIICSKYADGLPLYRQSQIFSRHNIDCIYSASFKKIWIKKLNKLIKWRMAFLF